MSTGDKYWLKTTVLIPGSDPAGSTTVVDLAGGPKLTLYNGLATSSANLLFDNNTLYFAGDGDIGIFRYYDNIYGQLSIGTGDFCVEAMIYVIDVNTVYVITQLIGAYLSGGFPHLAIYNTGGNALKLYTGNAGTKYSSIPITLNTWTHVVYNRVSGTSRFFIDGVQRALFANTTNYSLSATNDVNVGGYTSGSTSSVSNRLHGYIAQLRITKGAGRYVSDFSPPNEPFPNFPFQGGPIKQLAKQAPVRLNQNYFIHRRGL